MLPTIKKKKTALCFFSWSKCSSADALGSKLNAVNTTPKERQYESTDGCVYSGGPASPVGHIKNLRENCERPTAFYITSLLHADYRIGVGTEPGDDSAKIKLGTAGLAR